MNTRIAAEVAAVVDTVLAAQFSAVGMGGSDGDASVAPFTRESDSKFTSWSSGRRNCRGMLVELSLKPRQDALQSLLGGAAPQLAALLGPVGGGTGDTLTLEIPLDEPLPPLVPSASASSPTAAAELTFSLGVVRSSEKTAFLATRRDLARFGRKVAGDLMPAGMEALAETPAVFAGVLQGDKAAFTRVLANAPGLLRSVHITTDADMAKEALRTGAASSKRVAQFVFTLPAALTSGSAASREKLEAALRPWLTFALAVTDALPTLRFSPETRAAVADARAALGRERAKKEAAAEAIKRREEAVADAIKKRRDRAAELAGMDREARRKAEEKDRLDEMARRMKMRTKRA